MTPKAVQKLFDRYGVKTAPLEDSLPRATVSTPASWLERPPVKVRALAAVEPSNDAEVQPLSPEALAEVRAEAEAEGLKAARDKVELIMERYADAIERLDQAMRLAARPRAADVVDLALVVAREIIGQELLIDRELMIGVLEHSLEGVREQPGAITVRMGSTDLQFVMKRRPELAESGLRFVEDPNLGIGGCVVETDLSVLDASMETRLNVVRESLVELIGGAMNKKEEEAA